MTLDVPDLSPGVPCHKCGYDLRAQQHDAACPECGASVELSRRLASIPARPRWRASDPRWRRRMLAGVWTLALLPLMDVLNATGWAAGIRVPTVFHRYGMFGTLAEAFISDGWVYRPLVFCIGVVLLFSREQGRRPTRLDWTRRWGVICCYVTFLIAAANVLCIAALVCVGIGAEFLGMPRSEQPRTTHWFVDVGSAYLHYGPYTTYKTDAVQAVFSSVAVLLACIPMFNALRSCSPRVVAALLVGPLALCSLVQVAQVGGYFAGLSDRRLSELSGDGVYFCPNELVSDVATIWAAPLGSWGSDIRPLLVEPSKWCLVVVIALWLTIARLIPSRVASPALLA